MEFFNQNFDVPFEISRENVLMFLRRHVEPVAYTRLLGHFCESLDSETKRSESKTLLNKVLVMSINSGTIMNVNSYFFAGCHAEDMEEIIDLSHVEDISPNLSAISFSSCESILADEEVFAEESDTNDGDTDGEVDNSPVRSTSAFEISSTPEVFQYPSDESSVGVKK